MSNMDSKNRRGTIQSQIQSQLAKIKKWQVEEMGNTCSICHGNNAETECCACGWWGRVPPKDKNHLKKVRNKGVKN